jgi:hypothetical protein
MPIRLDGRRSEDSGTIMSRPILTKKVYKAERLFKTGFDGIWACHGPTVLLRQKADFVGPQP